jgi:hypothetical protein
MSACTIYLWGIYGNVYSLLCFLSKTTIVLYVCVFFIKTLIRIFDEDEESDIEELNNVLKKIPIKIAIILCVITMLMPSKGDIAMMYIIPKITNNETVKDMPEMYQMVKESLEKYVGDK